MTDGPALTRHALAGLLTLALLLLPRVSFGTGGAPTETWVSRYNGAGNNDDGAAAVAVDSSGNVYVTGYTTVSGSNKDYLTVKYDGGTGAQIWTAQYNGPTNLDDRAAAIAVDSAGNVVVTGYSTGTAGTNVDYATLKYNGGTGEQIWVKRYNGPGNFVDRATAIGVDTGNNVFVTGRSYGGTTNDDYATLKYQSADGTALWTSRYSPAGVNNVDVAQALVVDSNGDVIVTGYSRGASSGDDYATVKYAGATGAQAWVMRYNGPGNGTDQARSVAVDASNNPIVTGLSLGSGTSNDFATVKHNAVDGAALWTDRYNGPPGNSADNGAALVVDSAGDVFVTGASVDSASAVDYATRKINGSTGAAMWTSRFNGPVGSGNDFATAIALDPSGNPVVTGNSFSSTSDDYFTIAYGGPTGAELWSARYNGPSNDMDFPLDVVVDSQGNVLVTGYSGTSTATNDFATVKYIPPGPATNVTASCLVTRSGLKKSLATGRWSQTVTVKNTSVSTITGPISIALDNLSVTASLFNKAGDTFCTSPTGSPYRTSNGSLAPGASFTLVLDFTNPTNSPINWTGRVLAGSGLR